MQAQTVRLRVTALLKQMGISKSKLGEVLGSKSKSVQAKIDRANRFLKTQKSVSLDEVNSLTKFFGKPASYFIGSEIVASDGSKIYGQPDLAQIEAASGSEIERILKQLGKNNPAILSELDQSKLDLKTKRAILRAFYAKR
jgi:transcriptional regulator with XRE-family HTH domain